MVHNPDFSKERIRMFRKILSIILLIWSFFLVQTNEGTQLFFNEDSETLYSCVTLNPFSSNCNWNEYGFGITFIMFVMIIPLAALTLFDFTKWQEKSDTKDLASEWSKTNKKNLALLLMFGVVFTYYIVTSSNRWVAQQEAYYDSTERLEN